MLSESSRWHHSSNKAPLLTRYDLWRWDLQKFKSDVKGSVCRKGCGCCKYAGRGSPLRVPFGIKAENSGDARARMFAGEGSEVGLDPQSCGWHTRRGCDIAGGVFFHPLPRSDFLLARKTVTARKMTRKSEEGCMTRSLRVGTFLVTTTGVVPLDTMHLHQVEDCLRRNSHMTNSVVSKIFGAGKTGRESSHVAVRVCQSAKKKMPRGSRLQHSHDARYDR